MSGCRGREKKYSFQEGVLENDGLRTSLEPVMIRCTSTSPSLSWPLFTRDELQLIGQLASKLEE
jgi:hypothetical protein